MEEQLDPHTSRAAEMYNVPYSQVTPEQRRQAKAAAYRIGYGVESTRMVPEMNLCTCAVSTTRINATTATEPVCLNCGKRTLNLHMQQPEPSVNPLSNRKARRKAEALERKSRRN